ncbi:ATP-binding protein [Flavobacterium sp.]|uniref:AAA family ATPase n=1 Tax=Flavobacterium sp. TaxID=239 RepID=UPI001B763AE2|nr:ATP-binding protein [Flavobacterium sp.]MBP6182992.1 ATP-binding protein [Flavobacterium sp.]
MLVRFYLENFKSFNKKFEFNMLAGAYQKHPNHVFIPKNHDDLKILKNTAIYGANASGKTNFLHGLVTLQKIIANKPDNRDNLLPYFPFKMKAENVNVPTQFEVDFIVDDLCFNYGLSYNENTIISEWLYILKKQGSEMVFERKTDSAGKTELKFIKGLFPSHEAKIRTDIYQKDLQPNQTFINEGYNKDIRHFNAVYKWFTTKLTFKAIDGKFSKLPYLLSNNVTFSNNFNDILKQLDLGIDLVKVKETSFDDFFGSTQEKLKEQLEKSLASKEVIDIGNGSEFLSAYRNEKGVPVIGNLILLHKDGEGNLIDFEYNEESCGTQKLLDLIPGFIEVINTSSTLLVDEIESSIHPILIKSILKIFSGLNTKHDGQIIFTSHESTLLDLDLFRQDEIWFCEKNDQKESCLISLSDFKVRFDLDIRKGYLEGKFGGIPYVNISKLI